MHAGGVSVACLRRMSCALSHRGRGTNLVFETSSTPTWHQPPACMQMSFKVHTTASYARRQVEMAGWGAGGHECPGGGSPAARLLRMRRPRRRGCRRCGAWYRALRACQPVMRGTMGTTCSSALCHVPVHHALGPDMRCSTGVPLAGHFASNVFVVNLLGSAWRWPALLLEIISLERPGAGPVTRATLGASCCVAALLTCAGCCQRRRRGCGSLPARLALQSQLPPQLRVRPACQPTALLLILCSSTPNSQGPSTAGQFWRNGSAADTACCQTRSDTATTELLHAPVSCSSA